MSFLSYCYYELLTLRLNKLESFGRSKVQKHFHESYSCESDCSGSLVAKESFSSMDKNSADEAASIIDIFLIERVALYLTCSYITPLEKYPVPVHLEDF